MTARQVGVSACVMAILLLGISLFGGGSVLGAAGATKAGAAAAPHVMDAWVRLPAVSSRPAGGYFMVHGTARPDALVSASSPKAARVEMHSMSMVNGVMRMRAETRFPVTAKGTLSFAPGGNHLMLFGLAPDVKPGQTIPITLGFESGAKATVQARTMAAAAPAPEKAHQH